jgi:hypothetical protein
MRWRLALCLLTLSGLLLDDQDVARMVAGALGSVRLDPALIERYIRTERSLPWSGGRTPTLKPLGLEAAVRDVSRWL